MDHCQRFLRSPMSRREMLANCASGFGAIALAALMAENGSAAGADAPAAAKGTAVYVQHHAAKARNVIFLYMDGGPSHVDIFDYKPMLEKYAGKSPYEVIGNVADTQFANVGAILPSPWKFKQYGQSGVWVSDLFPCVAKCVDDLAVIRSMTSEFSEHTNANYFLHTGSGLQGRPSMGAWTTYGLGSECQNLPGFMVLNGGLIPPGGLDNFSNGFLPATYQGSVILPDKGVAYAHPTEATAEAQTRKLDLMKKLDAGVVRQIGKIDALESAISNYEVAYKMQSAVPDLMDIRGETAATKKLYGFDADFPATRIFAAECLMARRLVERGVRFIELTCPAGSGDRWDQHGGLRAGHTKNCKTVDQPIAALLTDLKARGLLEHTLVLWGGEFGRTPFAQGTDGRDHNPFGFTMFMAGGGVRGGTVFGATDEWGYRAVENRVTIHDLHATMLHLLGIDHTKLTFRFSGRDMRLTDVYGEIIHGILA